MKRHFIYSSTGKVRLNRKYTAVSLLTFAIALACQPVHAAPSCSKIFTEIITSNVGAQFLLERDPKLHTTPNVEKIVALHNRTTGRHWSKPEDRVTTWLTYLEKMATKSQSSSRTAKVVREALHNQFVMKSERIPESYYKQQVVIARERGHGTISLTEIQKQQLAESVLNDQRTSLDLWTDYLISKDTSMYPMWLKYWMVNGMAKLSKYEVDTGNFGKRSPETVAPFPELNREALAKVADMVLKKVDKKSLEDLNDPELVKLLDGMSFGKIYGRILFNLGTGREGSFLTNDGYWVVFPKGSDHMPLVKTLDGKNTGWCTAGEATAKSQLEKGDFHVYYSKDDSGKATVPRVAIRMEGDEIAEVRGVAAKQNIDAQINQTSIVKNKMNEFGSKADSFIKKDADMKYVTLLEKKQQNNEAFTKQDLDFIYETKSPIDGFGYAKDPRIQEILNLRDLKTDLVQLHDFKYTKEEISINAEEALSGHSKLHWGDLLLPGLPDGGFRLPRIVTGNLHIENLASAKGIELPESAARITLKNLIDPSGLKIPKSFKGELILSALTSAKGIEFPDSLKDLNLVSLTDPTGVKLPRLILGDLNLSSLETAEGIIFPNKVTGNISLDFLKTAKGLNLPENVDGTLILSQLQSGEGLMFPKKFTANISLPALTDAKGLKFPETVNGLTLSSLKDPTGLKLPKVVLGDLNILRFESAEGIVFPEVIRGSVFLNQLQTGQGLNLPENIGGSLYFERLQSGKNLKLPRHIGKSVVLDGLSSADGMVLPEYIGQHLQLMSLRSAPGLKLPERIDGALILTALQSAQGVIFPQKIGQGLYLTNLSTTEGFRIPEGLTGVLHFGRALTSVKGLIVPKTVTEYKGPTDF